MSVLAGKVPENQFIDKLHRISQVGIWKDHKPTSPDGNFARKSIVYGFNGTGKTSLSRVFASLEAKSLVDGLGDSARFQVEFSDGTIVSEANPAPPLDNHLLVFNSDFITRNFRWDEGAASSIFYIDEENIEKVNELRELENKLETASLRARAAKTQEDEAARAFQSRGTEIGGRVRDAWGRSVYSQKFDRRGVDREYSEKEFTDRDALSDARIDEIRLIIRQPEPNPKINFRMHLIGDFRRELKNACEIVQQGFEARLSSDLAAHPSMLSWVADGHQYHQEKLLGSCLYCGNEINKTRAESLTTLFSESWQAQKSALASAIDWCKQSRMTLREWLEGLLAVSSVQPNLAQRFGEASTALKAKVVATGTAIKELQEVLEACQRNPMDTHTVPGEVTKLLEDTWTKEFSDARTKVMNTLAEHNEIHDQFKERKTTAANLLKAHVLFGEQDDYRKLKRSMSDAEEEARITEKLAQELREKAGILRNAIRKHGIAANELNKLLHEYLGHSSIRLEALDEGYQLLRADDSVAMNLSEGEKTALTFCFFLTQFAAEGRDKKKLIVIIDDPVSSLDSNSQTFAFGLIKKHTKRVSQVILLTHNLKLMHMAKRAFFRGVNFSDGVPKGMLFIDCTNDKDGDRSSSLVRMPSYLALYDSEYQYLFSIIFQASEEKSIEYLYMLPNAIRKLLEIFTAFAAPDKVSFAEALFDDSGKIGGLDQAEMNQLERICQIESHGDIEAVSSLPALTVEESHRAASGAMKYIRERDKKHYDAMLRILRKAEND